MLGHLLVFVAVLLLVPGVLVVVLMDKHPFDDPAASVLWGTFWVYTGGLFLAAYAKPDGCYLYRFLMRVCRDWSRPPHAKMALFYAALGIGLGISAFATALGLLP